MIFAPNHHSHLDTALMVRAVPAAVARKLVVAAAADYFFDKRWKATLSALALNAIPIDRESTGRKSADHDPRPDRRRLEPRDLPRGRPLARRLGPGRSRAAPPTSPAAPGAPVVPVFIDGTGVDLRQGHEAAQAGSHDGRVRRARCGPVEGETHAPLQRPHRGAPSRRSATRRRTDYWTARRRAAAGHQPDARRPGVHRLAPRSGTSPKRRKLGIAGWRRRQTRRWPDLG